MGDSDALCVWLKEGHTVEVLRRCSREFTARTGVEVRVDTVPEGRAHDALLRGLARPDVVTVPYWYLGELAEREVLQPLDSWMDQEGVDWSAFEPVAVEALTRNDQRWAVPHTLTGGVVSFRQDLFEAAQLGPPDTLGAVLEAARTLRVGDQAPYGLVGRASAEFSSLETYSGWAWGNGIELLPQEGQPTPEVLEQGVGELVEVLRSTGPANLPELDYAEVGEIVGRGEAAQLFDTSAWSFFFEDPRSSSVAGRMGYTTAVGSEGPAQFLYAEGLGVTAWSERPQQAAAFIAWRQSEDCLRTEVEEVGRFDLPRRDLPHLEWYRSAVKARSLDSYLAVVRQSWAEADSRHLVRRTDFVPAARALMGSVSGVISGRYPDFEAALRTEARLDDPER